MFDSQRKITLNDYYMDRSAIFTLPGAVTGDAVCVTAGGTACEMRRDMEEERSEVITEERG